MLRWFIPILDNTIDLYIAEQKTILHERSSKKNVCYRDGSCVYLPFDYMGRNVTLRHERRANYYKTESLGSSWRTSYACIQSIYC